MSDNQNRKSRDFSKYDTMTTQQLRELLRLDSEAPDDGGTDTEELLYIMEVLADRNKDSFTGKTALEAWESFQRDYLDVEDDSESEIPDKVAGTTPKPSGLRRWLAAAAVIALLIGIPVTASALNWEEVWHAIVTWAGETFSFGTENTPEDEKPKPDNFNEYESLQKTLSMVNEDPAIVPVWIPERYTSEKIDILESPEKKIYVATYQGDSGYLTIKVQSYMSSDPAKIEANEGILEIYEANGIEYYIVQNQTRLKAMWIFGSYECYISGELTIEEIKTMIDSIGKG